jgi:hypothetical protein
MRPLVQAIDSRLLIFRGCKLRFPPLSFSSFKGKTAHFFQHNIGYGPPEHPRPEGVIGAALVGLKAPTKGC